MSEKKPEENKGDANKKAKQTPEADPFLLAKVFANPCELLSLPAIQIADLAKDAVYTLDTNALLEPFGLGKTGQEEITTLYSGLRETNRLFIPERSLQEYLKNREQKIAEIHDHVAREISDLGKKAVAPTCAMLEYSKEYQAVLEAAERLQSTQKDYLATMQGLLRLLENWRWDDPISKLYATLFDSSIVACCSTSEECILTDLEQRSRNKIPPGYKDRTKADRGVGDLLIWSSIMELAKTKGVDVIFVTNDAKADWMVRNSNGALYPRFELLSEFYRTTGRQIAIVNFVRFLELNDMSPETVDSVRHSHSEGLGRFDRLRQRILSILDRLNEIATDFSYVTISDGMEGIDDNRFSGLLRGLNECTDSYQAIFGDTPNLEFLRKCISIMEEIRSLQGAIEYERVRMKRSTVQEAMKIQQLCNEYMELWADFAVAVEANPVW